MEKYNKFIINNDKNFDKFLKELKNTIRNSVPFMTYEPNNDLDFIKYYFDNGYNVSEVIDKLIRDGKIITYYASIDEEYKYMKPKTREEIEEGLEKRMESISEILCDDGYFNDFLTAYAFVEEKSKKIEEFIKNEYSDEYIVDILMNGWEKN